jgi:hypothetical protein
VETTDVRLCVSDITEKLDNYLECKRKVWFDMVACGDVAVVRDDSADKPGGRVCQNMYTDSS